ncbi:lysozyme inhibitor LprI family protein [Erwinia mallotivora]|uniref:lysozyme inhibitor LprI family protein n=1 Tax=Erwinia mallotivora TaxID=69222 RepID=UPI0021C18BAB|nr:hypothetical protein [Erwinia mallotivora]
MKSLINALLLIAAFCSVSPATAIECARASTVVESTICQSPSLVWLDSLLNNTWRNVMQSSDPQGVNAAMRQWRVSRDACTSSSCLRWAYLQGIGQLYHVPQTFDWSGEWWNTTASNGNGGRLILNNVNQWAFDFDARVWGGAYTSTLRGNVKMFYGVGFVDNIRWGASCTVVFIPQPDGKITVSSDNDNSCKLIMPKGVAIDGVWQRATQDPRPPATLFSVGILPSKTLDDRFRQLAGKDYQQYIRVANKVTYAVDQDNLHATVLTLAVNGDASRRAAIIMYTAEGKIWAALLTPENGGQMHYLTSEQDQKTPPETINRWRALFQS